MKRPGGSGQDQSWQGAVVVRTRLALRGEKVAKPEKEETDGEAEGQAEHKARPKRRKHSLPLSSPKKISTVNDHKHLVSPTSF